MQVQFKYTFNVNRQCSCKMCCTNFPARFTQVTTNEESALCEKQKEAQWIFVRVPCCEFSVCEPEETDAAQHPCCC